MSFDVDLITDIPKLVQINTDNGRFYHAEDGSITDTPGYPSVTTVLGADKSKADGIRKWRERVGEEEANKISFRATERGTAVHLVMEDYVLGQKPQKKPMPHIMDMASGLKVYADKYISNIKMVEGQLFSHHLRTAGTVDLVAEFDGKMSIIDWKTSNWPKKRDNITNYFMQEAAYAVMFEERTGIPVTQLVTLVAYNEGTQMFVEKRDDWIGKFLELREMYDTQLQSMLQSQGADTVVSDS